MFELGFEDFAQLAMSSKRSNPRGELRGWRIHGLSDPHPARCARPAPVSACTVRHRGIGPVETVAVRHPRLGVVLIKGSDYDPDHHGAVLRSYDANGRLVD